MAPSPSSPRRGGNCFSCLCTVITVLAILFGGIYLLVWLSIRHGTAATAVSATLSRFDLADGPSSGPTLQYNLTVDIRVRNTKSYRIGYDHAEAQVSYAATERFEYGPVEPFSLKGKSEQTITAVFGGSSPIYDGNTVHTYQRERSEGFYFVKLRIYYQIEFRFRYSNARQKSKISCMLRLPVPNTSAAPMPMQLETMCDADY